MKQPKVVAKENKPAVAKESNGKTFEERKIIALLTH